MAQGSPTDFAGILDLVRHGPDTWVGVSADYHWGRIYGGQVVAQARAISPSVRIVARSHSEEETEHLRKHGANAVIMGEREIALAMLADVRGKTGTG